LRIPWFAQRIAVISAAGAAGYGDFCRQLEDNEYGFRFEVTLFPAIMQGEQVEKSIIAALNNIYAQGQKSYDCVVIIRGGGATADLSGFDTLALAENVAQFPLPIITGIGHDRDESIIDMVSNTRVKTPTAAAALLIDNLRQVWERLNLAQQRISMAGHIIIDARHRIEMLQQRLAMAIERLMTNQKHRLSQIELLLQSYDPQLLLRRGYSITLHHGRAVRDPQQLQAGDEIETRVEKGKITSIVK
jgi:exodeoxyribonuclease VII large subunit